MWTPKALLLGQRLPRPGPVRACVCPLFLAASGGPASRACLGAPRLSFGRFLLLLCSVPSGLGLPFLCFLFFAFLFVVFFPSLPAPPLSPAFCALWPGVPFALALSLSSAPPPPSPRPCPAVFGFFVFVPPLLFLFIVPPRVGPFLCCVFYVVFFFRGLFSFWGGGRGLGGLSLLLCAPLGLAAPAAMCPLVLLLCQACAVVGALGCVALVPLGAVRLRCPRCLLRRSTVRRCLPWCVLCLCPPPSPIPAVVLSVVWSPLCSRVVVPCVCALLPLSSLALLFSAPCLWCVPSAGRAAWCLAVFWRAGACGVPPGPSLLVFCLCCAVLPLSWCARRCVLWCLCRVVLLRPLVLLLLCGVLCFIPYNIYLFYIYIFFNKIGEE